MRIVFLSHTDPFGPFRVGSHHLSRELARLGHEVVHLSTPVSLAHLVTGRVRWARLAQTPPHSFVDGVRMIVPRTLLPAGLGAFSVSRELRRRGLTDIDLALIDQPLLWSRSAATIAQTFIYRPTDEYPSGIKARRQAAILQVADAVVATSHRVLEALGDTGLPALVIENGVDVEHFPPRSESPRPATCVYVGAFDSRFDWDQVRRWAEESPAWRFRMIGPLGASPTALPDNIELFGPADYDDLPRLLADARIGLLPLSSDALNRGRSPMKLYEYLSSGLQVVSRETAGIRTALDVGIHTYTDPVSASEALRASMDAPTPNIAGATHAASQSWKIKARALVEFARSVPVS